MAVAPAEQTMSDFGVDVRDLPTGDGGDIFDLKLALDKVPPQEGTIQSSNGLYLMQDETEVFAAGFLTGLNSLVAAASCCFLALPTANRRLDICVTDKRIVFRDARRKLNPGIKSCWYYWVCCCFWVDEIDEKSEEQVVLNLDDLKNVQMELMQIQESDGTGCCGSCCAAEKRIQQFRMVLYFTKDVGVYHLPTKGWSFAEENKTSWLRTEPIVAFGNMEKAAEMRRVLDEAVAQNLARDASKVTETRRVLANGAAN